MEEQIKQLLKTASLYDGVFGSLFGDVSLLVKNINGFFYVSFYTKTSKVKKLTFNNTSDAVSKIKKMI